MEEVKVVGVSEAFCVLNYLHRKGVPVEGLRVLKDGTQPVGAVLGLTDAENFGFDKVRPLIEAMPVGGPVYFELLT